MINREARSYIIGGVAIAIVLLRMLNPLLLFDWLSFAVMLLGSLAFLLCDFLPQREAKALKQTKNETGQKVTDAKPKLNEGFGESLERLTHLITAAELYKPNALSSSTPELGVLAEMAEDMPVLAVAGARAQLSAKLLSVINTSGVFAEPCEIEKLIEILYQHNLVTSEQYEALTLLDELQQRAIEENDSQDVNVRGVLDITLGVLAVLNSI